MRLSGCECADRGVLAGREAAPHGRFVASISAYSPAFRPTTSGRASTSFEEYLACKRELFSQCALSIGNIDDEYYEQVVSNRFGRLTFGLSEKADYRAEDTAFTVSADGFSTVFYLPRKGKRHELKLKLPGIFSVYNALGAIAVARELRRLLRDDTGRHFPPSA